MRAGLAQLIEYAEAQGSKSMRKQAYTIYTKLVNSLVGIEAGQRGEVPFKTLSTIAFLEDMILHTISEEMSQGVYYKEIYQHCKGERQADHEVCLSAAACSINLAASDLITRCGFCI